MHLCKNLENKNINLIEELYGQKQEVREGFLSKTSFDGPGVSL